jgi:uncharacterized membrane protein YfcA
MELGLDLFLFLAATFTAALLAGLAGFAFGIVAASAWLHILTPVQTATLIVWYGLIVQGYAVWKLRHAIRWDRITPMVLGSACGIPVTARNVEKINAVLPFVPPGSVSPSRRAHQYPFLIFNAANVLSCPIIFHSRICY